MSWRTPLDIHHWYYCTVLLSSCWIVQSSLPCARSWEYTIETYDMAWFPNIIITIIHLLFSEFSYRFLMFFDVIFPPVIFLALYYQSAQNLFMNQKTSHSIFKDRLNVVNGFMMYTFEDRAPRLDIPKSLRRQIIMNFHAANQGSTSMLARARDDVYWPNMDNDINNHVSSCSQCRESAPSQQKEPLLMTEAPEYPFQHTVADLF